MTICAKYTAGTVRALRLALMLVTSGQLVMGPVCWREESGCGRETTVEGGAMSMCTLRPRRMFYFFYFFKFIFYCYFQRIPMYSMGTQLHIHVYIIFSPIVMLRCKYLNIVLRATQQDLIVNPFQEQ